ncbi:TonB-dependent siderophore receptor [Hydrogenophaga sp.]|uniref:TonB-dependent siderophore receptor n=1 Tax=Hydrogenophaga sp. TaxID=1904254 RepID=UPI0025C49233|nr:TonB-dependent siderophore receptor [Hydrogenophaga sp.]MBT9464634.1 TonB-dependent siderophore receptor [Hydrogenophaga sp.]
MQRTRPTATLRPIALASLVSCMVAAPAWAQSNTSTLPQVEVRAGESRAFTSSSIQVGTFRDQDPLDVPLTNQAITREVIEAQGSTTLYGALRNTAGVSHAQIGNATYDNIAIRGLLVDNQRNYRLNGSLPIVNLIDTPLENKERVEVLKGAASLYYGLVPPSGIVNLVTKRPTAQPLTTVTTSINDHGAVGAHVDLSRRYGEGDEKGIRLNVAAGTQEVGVSTFEGSRSLFSLAHDLRISRDATLKLDLEHYRKNVSEPATIVFNSAQGVPEPVDNRLNHAGQWQRYDAEATNVLLRSDINLDDTWALTLEAGHAETTRDRNFSTLAINDLTTGASSLNVFYQRNQRFANTNARAELVGALQTGDVSHELTFGFTSNARRFKGEGAPTVSGISQNYYNPRVINPVAAGTWTPAARSRVNDRGLYVFDRIRLGDQWQVLAGVRRGNYSSQTGTGPTFKYDETSPNLSVIYKPSSDVSIYGSYLEALDEGGTARFGRTNVGEVLPPAVNKQRELGIKTRLAGGIQAQAALFDISRPLVTVDGNNRDVLGGESTYRGLEVSVGGEISRQWSLLASAVFLDAEITSVSAFNANELGKTPENTARSTFSLFGEYRIASVPGWSLNGGVYFVGKRAVNNLNQGYVPAYTTVSLGTRYATKWGNSPVTLQANLDNATNRDYWVGTGGNFLSAGLPRTLRVAATFAF